MATIYSQKGIETASSARHLAKIQ